MAWSDILTLIGLFLGTLGAILLAIDVIYGPGKREQAGNIKTNLAVWQNLRMREQEAIKGSEGYSAERIKQELEQEEKRNGPEEKRLKDLSESFLRKYELTITGLGALGVILIVIGFVFQIFGIFAHAREENAKKQEQHQTDTHTVPNGLVVSRPGCIGSFPSGEDRGAEQQNAIKLLSEKLNTEMTQKRLMALLVVGSVDKQPLRGEQKRKFKTNRGLAQARAGWVESNLRGLIPSLPKSVVILASGPTIEAATKAQKQEDRHVAIYSVWDDGETSKAAELDLGSQLRCADDKKPS